ncbi:MAG: type IV secretory system conjugative DNA transfer family protein, partial [Ruminococcus sp.]|nr:type IV secretory system conjugative DNA transfer family protein [Ruminococcus sp.]
MDDYNPWEHTNGENYERYDTYDIDEIMRIENFSKKRLDEYNEEKAAEKVSELLPAIQEQERENARKEIREEYRLAEVAKILELSPFISESVTISGKELYPNCFIPDKPFNEPVSEETKLYPDDENDRWLVRVKNGLPKFISTFVVIACFIVDASGPGSCRAYVVFLKGEAKPLIFWEGVIDPAELRKQTQFHKKGLSYGIKDLYHQSFLRALRNCNSVYFHSLPKHAGWNRKPDGSLIFVDSAMMKPEFEGLFLKDDAKDKKKECNKNKLHNIYLDISLVRTERKFGDVKAVYHTLLPDTLPIIIGTVISATSRLLPQYKEEGLVQDRLLVMETSDDDTAKSMIAVLQNKNHSSTEAFFSSMRMPYIEEEITHFVDCVAIIRHSCTICSMHDCNKVIKYLYELLQNGYGDDDFRRFLPVLLIDNAGTIPEEFQIHQLSVADRLKVDSIEQVQRVMGELDYFVVKLAERNPDAVKQRLKAAITSAKEIVSTLPRRSQSSSAVMLISTAIMLAKGGVLTDADVQGVQDWLRTEAKSRTSMGRSVVKAAGTALSKAICSGVLKIAYQFGPPFWSYDKAFIASDDSLNITRETLEEEILPELPVGKNKALEYLQKEDALNTDGGDQKTWTVETEDGKRKPRRFYSFSRDLLTSEADRIVDEAVASDLFHKPDEPIDIFFPFIKHRRLDMVAGQVITDYKHGNPFISVTGTPGSGKTDWLHMQVVQRAKAGDVVVVLDPTNSFCREELSGHKIPEEIIDNHFIFWDMSTQGWPVNILDFEGCEDITQRVQRLSSLLISGMHLTGSVQIPIVMTKAEEWLQEYVINNSLSIHDLPARFDGNTEERKLKTKLAGLLSTVKDTRNGVQPPGWNKLLSERGKVLVISAGNATIKIGANPFDILFDTLYSFKDKNRDGRITVVLDEVQTLNHGGNSTLVNVLSRGRKLDISVILASQDYLNRSLAAVYKYCGTHILFRPLGDECINAVAELTKLDINIIRTLPDFCCAIMGLVYSEHFKKNIQLKSAIVGE